MKVSVTVSTQPARGKNRYLLDLDIKIGTAIGVIVKRVEGRFHNATGFKITDGHDDVIIQSLVSQGLSSEEAKGILAYVMGLTTESILLRSVVIPKSRS